MSEITVNSEELPKPDYKYITKEADAKEALNIIKNYDIIEVDTEGTGLDPFTSKVTLLQMGVPDHAFVFDVRSDTEHSDIDFNIFKDILTSKKHLKLLQNAVYDMKMVKHNFGFYIETIYDTMLVEQVFNLGAGFKKASLDAIVQRYLGMNMPKEPRTTFSEYNQTFKPYQLEYAANDVCILTLIRDCQLPRIKDEGLEDVCRLEFEFTMPMAEMELNGISIDVNKWRTIMSDVDRERIECIKRIEKEFGKIQTQNTLFNNCLINIKSNAQLKKALNDYGIPVEDTKAMTLNKFKGVPLVDDLLNHSKLEKLISTYSETLLERIHPYTNRLHTSFKQMVSTGRMSSSNPNLQNIPNKQKYRSCFISKPGYSLITADMSGAELRILGNMSEDPIFVDSYANGIDLHTKAASEVFGVPYEKVTKKQRGASKAIQFGLCYGLSKYGLARRLEISEDEAENMINKYFGAYKGVKSFLDNSANDAIRNKYSRSISGRKRYYDLPFMSDPDYKRIAASIKRQGMNAPIQGSNADTIKQAMVYLVKRLEGKPAKLVLTVHDEVVVETKHEYRHEIAEIVSQSLIDGFGRYFTKIPMETDALIGPCWLKSEHEKKSDGSDCGGTEMKSIEDEKYGTKIVCAKCGEGIE